MTMNKATKVAAATLIVAGGVIVAGWLMNRFKGQVPFLADASEGYQGI